MTTKEPKFNPHKNTTNFMKHLETGLTEMGLDFMDYKPTGVFMNNGESCYLVSQVPNSEDADDTFLVTKDGIEFPDSTVKIMFKGEEQPPSMVAILFLTSILQKKLVSPNCPHCEEEK